MTTATSVPDNLLDRFQNWDAKGRPAQPSFPWRLGHWQRWIPAQSDLFARLPNPIGRADVTHWFTAIDSPAAALEAYLASYLWGYARANTGPYRALQPITLNTVEGGNASARRDFAEDLLTLARVAQDEGGVAAFEHVAARRRTDRNFFRKWGPAFGTKFISFATKASPAVATTPIMDSIATDWFNEHATGCGPLVLSWTRPESYAAYTRCLTGWGRGLGIEPDEAEQLIFMPYPS